MSMQGQKDLANRRLKPALLIGALGVVYGDIGTSPLYTISETFFGHYKMPMTAQNIMGAVSLVFWSLMLVVTVKYIGLIMRADNNGEGGIFALMGLISQHERTHGKASKIPAWLGSHIIVPIIMGACLLYGDGMITPAISVLSAVEGLKVVTPAAGNLVIPITVAILLGLFALQKRGTRSVGGMFGPVMLLWFVTIGALGLWRALEHPRIFLALNPEYAVRMLLAHKFYSFFILGAVVLCVTGSEALYADMGHFGRRIISRSWMFLVFPSLCLNYLGQGAVLFTQKNIPGNHVFYALCPPWMTVPMVLLATVATIIASQALISGAYSLTQQAIALGVFPRLKVVHTNPEIRGQIYVPFINFILLLGCIWLVIGFKTSGALAAAYGIAVTGTMAVTTLAFAVIAKYLWGWKNRYVWPIFIIFFGIDLTFFGSNLLKFKAGGYIPIVIGLLLFLVMDSWRWGRRWLSKAYQEKLANYDMTVEEIIHNKRQIMNPVASISLVVMSSRPVLSLHDKIPPVLAVHFHNWKRLPKHLIFFSVIQSGIPFADENKRYQVTVLEETKEGTVVSVQANYGYMEQPNVRSILAQLKVDKQIKIPQDPDKWLILIGVELFISQGRTPWERFRIGLFSRINRLSKPVTDYFGLETDSGVAMETINV